jgi:RimJ/RimL family protein N-acetyltransferase
MNSMRKIFTKSRIIFASIVALIGLPLLYFVYVHQEVSTAQTSHSSTQVVYPQEIVGKIITLKKISLAYAFDYFTMYSPMVRKLFEAPEKITFSDVEYDISEKERQMNKGTRCTYIIWDNKDKKLVGAIEIRERRKDDNGQLGMWLNEKYWGGGRIHEAMKLISKVYFEVNPLVSNYIAHVRPWNMRSLRAMLKTGFRKIDDFIEEGKITRYVLQKDRL